MGAEFDATWSVDSHRSGTAKGFCCLNARAIDFARFGLLFLDDGRAGGRQVVPAEWVRQSTAAQQLDGMDDGARRNIETNRGRPSAFYAWQWRRALDPAVADDAAPQPGADFYAQGLLGQYVYVAPSTRTVVVRLGSRRGEVSWPVWLGELARLNP
jgi:CubicO group peptidase (beta-lactamase class C family)